MEMASQDLSVISAEASSSLRRASPETYSATILKTHILISFFQVETVQHSDIISQLHLTITFNRIILTHNLSLTNLTLQILTSVG